MADKVRPIGAILVSLVTAGLAVWWLFLVGARLGLKPEVNAQGVVVLDQFQRAKDILLVVLPLFSASLAYWVGSQGTADAKEEAAGAKNQLEAVLDTSPQGVLEAAKEKFPEAFSK